MWTISFPFIFFILSVYLVTLFHPCTLQPPTTLLNTGTRVNMLIIFIICTFFNWYYICRHWIYINKIIWHNLISFLNAINIFLRLFMFLDLSLMHCFHLPHCIPQGMPTHLFSLSVYTILQWTSTYLSFKLFVTFSLGYVIRSRLCMFYLTKWFKTALQHGLTSMAFCSRDWGFEGSYLPDAWHLALDTSGIGDKCHVINALICISPITVIFEHLTFNLLTCLVFSSGEDLTYPLFIFVLRLQVFFSFFFFIIYLCTFLLLRSCESFI